MITAIVADDEPAVASIIRHFIEKEGLPLEIVSVAENGEQALQQIRTLNPGLVFLDIQMPIHNGLEVMRLEPGARYIIITAYESFNYAQAALRLGASDILLKPIDHLQLIEAIARAIGYQFTRNLLVNQVLGYLHQNYTRQIDLGQLTERFHTTPSHLARTFKKHMGLSIVSYLNKLRIDKAKVLLEDQSLSVQGVASSLGYESLNNFYKNFKMFTDMTPSCYRQRKKPASSADSIATS